MSKILRMILIPMFFCDEMNEDELSFPVLLFPQKRANFKMILNYNFIQGIIQRVSIWSHHN